MASRECIHAAADICECAEGSKPQLRSCLIHAMPSRGKGQSMCVDVQAARALLYGRAHAKQRPVVAWTVLPRSPIGIALEMTYPGSATRSRQRDRRAAR